ncbi:D-amino-acid oxidase [Kibdelosporangium banguiense]|uniref:D-amino-acid oxidase n=1 Tax=Kibdelosporangium banguiense TaxID=1365924 RepID=A0ABS4TDY7_9PSEU|nr:FAD-dependent oxidoreductase [Kibdelosporangium banguiense]MBP2322636.1 D-amino-acid oxidase [Kibdelosporangium banguiense]
MDVLVIGAGVIGLTTATTLTEAGHSVRVQAAEPPDLTTSAAAGALWGPWLVEPHDRVYAWAAHTLHVLTELADTPGTGVRLASGKDVSMAKHEPPDWFRLLPNLRSCTEDELPPGYRHGVHYTAPLIDMPTHLAYLMKRLQAVSVEIEVAAVESLQDASSMAPVVVNCTGLGARKLAGDDQLFPIRGQQLVVSNPGLTEFLEVDTGDSPDLIAIYPHGDHVVLGGTAEPGSRNREPDLATAESILARCAAVQPLLKDAVVLEHRVGLRPTRPEIRLEEEHFVTSKVIHNYGHGGAGVSVAWGCAATVTELVSRQ